MKIALDAFGGDNGPEVIIRGALDFLKDSKAELYLTGPENKIKSLLGKNHNRITIIDAPDLIDMAEKASSQLRNRKESSMYKCVDLVSQGKAHACLSAGSSAAMMALSVLLLKRIHDLERPALVTPLPNIKGTTYCLDMGANVDCKPIHLVHFALMGHAYAQSFSGIEKPRIGLMSNGEEEGKGNELTRETHTVLKSIKQLNYLGYCEGGDIYNGRFDVIVCDGFVGNIILKTSEGLAETLMDLLKESFTSTVLSKLGYLLAKSSLRSMKKKIDYAQYGGVPLLGVNGISLISHGRSSSVAITNALRAAETCIDSNLVEKLSQSMTFLPKVESINASMEDKGS